MKENHTSIDVFHRMQLIDDCNALAQAGVIRYNILLRMLQYFPQETEYGPLTVLNKISISLKNRLSGTFAEKYIYVSIKRNHPKLQKETLSIFPTPTILEIL